MVIKLVDIVHKPTQAQTFKWDGSKIPLEMLREAFPTMRFSEDMFRKCGEGMMVKTNHGYSYMVPGGWLIVVVSRGEIYPNDKSVFEQAWQVEEE